MSEAAQPKTIKDALREVLNEAQAEESPQGLSFLDAIAWAHVKKAAAGDMSAIKELYERIEGRVAQIAIDPKTGETYAIQVIRFADDSK